MELRWVVSFSATCLHAAEACFLGRQIVDPELAAAIAEPADRLRVEIATLPVPARPFWRMLAGLAGRLENNRELVTTALAKCGQRNPSDSLVTRVAGRLADLESAVRQRFPGLVDEIALRAGPLREQWEARGPGLLRAVAEWLGPEGCVSQAEVVLVKPATGGGGAAHLPLNLVRFEALLYNSIRELPEVVRLGWLLAQLNLELPKFSEAIAADRLPSVAELAMLPVVLESAEPVELACYDRAHLQRALTAWPLDTAVTAELAGVVDSWWQEFRESRPPLTVALMALDRMLRGAGGTGAAQ